MGSGPSREPEPPQIPEPRIPSTQNQPNRPVENIQEPKRPVENIQEPKRPVENIQEPRITSTQNQHTRPVENIQEAINNSPVVPNEEARKTMRQSSKSSETNKTVEATRPVGFPHKYEEILKEADSFVDTSSMDKLYDKLYAGVFLNQKHKKYWVDKMSNANCFMLYAKDLSITWGNTERYWTWSRLPESEEFRDVLIQVAELVDVCWLEIHGRFNTARLSPGLTYKVVFIAKLNDNSYGWETPVKLRLTLPNGSRNEHEENMMKKPRGEWIDIQAGEVTTSANNNGEIEFSLYEYECGNWKKGLVIKGAVLQPKS